MGKLRVKSIWLWAALGAVLATQYYSAKFVWVALMFFAVYAGEAEDKLHEHYQDKIAKLESEHEDALRRARDPEWYENR